MQPACGLGWGEKEAVELLTKWFTSWLALQIISLRMLTPLLLFFTANKTSGLSAKCQHAC